MGEYSAKLKAVVGELVDLITELGDCYQDMGNMDVSEAADEVENIDEEEVGAFAVSLPAVGKHVALLLSTLPPQDVTGKICKKTTTSITLFQYIGGLQFKKVVIPKNLIFASKAFPGC